MKNINYLLSLYFVVFLLTGCMATAPKVVNASKENNSDVVTKVNNIKKIKPVLTGIWTLNKDLSDNLQEKIKESRQQAAATKGSSNKGGGRGGNGGGRKGDGSMKNKSSGGNRAGSRKGAFPQELREFLMASKTLELKHDEPLLTIITKNGHKQRVYTDFRGVSISANGGMNQKITTAGWEGDVLVVETTLSSASYIQRYRQITGSRQLWISSVVLTSSLPRPLKFNRVYELTEIKNKEVRIGKDAQ